MDKFTQFDHESVGVLKDELNQVLRDFGEQYGVSVSLGNARYAAGEVRFPNVRVTIQHVKAGADDAHLDQMMDRYGVASKLGVSGRKLIRFKSANRTYPWIVSYQGKQWKYSTEQVLTYFGRVPS